MLFRRYNPGPPLDAFVEFLWYYDAWDGAYDLQRVLPDGTFELVINLRDEPRRLFDRDDPVRATPYRRSWLSGPHSRYIVIETRQGGSMIGAHFHPGGIAPFLRPSTREFQDQVVECEALWGQAAKDWRECLLHAVGPGEKLRLLEKFLRELLGRARMDERRWKAVNWATREFARDAEGVRVADAATQLGISHKHFIHQFQQQVGLTPKLFARIRRFQGVLSEINAGGVLSWADVAGRCGYYDQAHFIHDFQRFAGINPSAYLQLEEPDTRFIPAKGR